MGDVRLWLAGSSYPLVVPDVRVADVLSALGEAKASGGWAPFTDNMGWSVSVSPDAVQRVMSRDLD